MSPGVGADQIRERKPASRGMARRRKSRSWWPPRFSRRGGLSTGYADGPFWVGWQCRSRPRPRESADRCRSLRDEYREGHIHGSSNAKSAADAKWERARPVGRNGTKRSEVEVRRILDQGLTGSDADLVGERPHPSAPTPGRHEVTECRGNYKGRDADVFRVPLTHSFGLGSGDEPWRLALTVYPGYGHSLSLPFNPFRCLHDLRPFVSRTGSAPRRTPNGDPRVRCGG